MQVKTARTSDGWGVPGQGGGATAIPVYYRTQCAWYMAVTGLSRWDVAVYFIANDEFRRYPQPCYMMLPSSAHVR